MNSRKQLIESARHHRLLNKALEKQFRYYRDRFIRLELRVEAFEQFLGFKAIRDKQKLSWNRISRQGRPKIKDGYEKNKIQARQKS